MRRRMIQDRRLTTFDVDLRLERRADRDRTTGPASDVSVENAAKLDRVADSETAVLADDDAGVADLSAGFGIERRAIEDQDRFVAVAQRIQRTPVAHDREQLRIVGAERVVAEELRRRECRRKLGRQA